VLRLTYRDIHVVGDEPAPIRGLAYWN
jgi:hypothetical protein